VDEKKKKGGEMRDLGDGESPVSHVKDTRPRRGEEQELGKKK